MQDDQVLNDLFSEAMDYLGYDEQSFMMMQAQYMQNPQTQGQIMQAQLGAGSGEGPKLSRQKAKEIFKEQEQKKMEKMGSMMGMMQNMNSQADQQEGMITMMAEHAKVSDEMFFKYGVEEDEFNESVMHYNLMQDPEIMAMMQANMQKMGLGGMPGMGQAGPGNF